MILIRNETPDDHKAIRALTAAAFGNSELGHHGEAQLVASLRAACSDPLSLVACLDDEVVGHILFTPVTLRTPQHDLPGMGLAPLSVAPERQRAGIGARLVMSGLEQLFGMDCCFVVVLGHQEYYSRFGFQPAAQFGVSHGFAGVPQDAFLVRFHPTRVLKNSVEGRAYYRPEFGPQFV